MIRKPEVLRDYARINPLSQVQFGNNVIAALMANPTVFIPADLPVSALDLTAATSDLSAKYNDYKIFGSSKKEAFVVSQAIWVAKFNLIADYVELIATASGQDAGVIIQLAGFHLTKTETEPSVIPGQPDTEIEIGTVKGEISINSKAMKGTKGFCFAVMSPDFQMQQIGNQITLKVGDSFASFIIGTEREVSFQGLPSYIDAKASAAAFNSAGLGSSNVKTVTIP